ncbi:hypothetical protein GCM10025870_21020 [Agromyces marinus]|uniref:Uncharacterized protein n=1 Tax=Agromyces marinus TaxID=1389020 RepID=A0ABM8H2M4_9MICO|nr:hypothetical protein [Agromyces marinus]BDZ55029.1 hypothetical protein GCM10025870_21020 [Agromyces marinus]
MSEPTIETSRCSPSPPRPARACNAARIAWAADMPESRSENAGPSGRSVSAGTTWLYIAPTAEMTVS